jgi:RNA processing factor Prp31
MATLADSFLADLDELSDNEADIVEEDADETANMEEDIDGDLADIETLNYDDLDSVSKLQKTQRYSDLMQKVEDALEKGSSDISTHAIVLEDDPEYQLIVDCNALSVDIENEIIIIHNFIRDKYRLKFPELESLVHHPIDYARVVKKIDNEMDLTLVDLEGLLPSAIIMWFLSRHQPQAGNHSLKTFFKRRSMHVTELLCWMLQRGRFLISLKAGWDILHQIFLLFLGVLLQQNLWGQLVVCLH